MSNYQVHVAASPKSMRDDPSLPHALMHVTYIVRSMYVSSGQLPSPFSGICDHYSKQHFECAPFVSTDDSPLSPSWGFISSTLDNLGLPFPLDRLRRINLDGREGASGADQARDEIVSQILTVACGVVNDPRNEGRKRFGVWVDIRKVVTLPENEIQEMGRSLMVAILRAPEPAIPGLEKAVILKQGDTSEVCGICLEEQAVGDVVGRLGCSHEFHSSCIEKWLKIARTCPTCRHKLPTRRNLAS